MWRWKMRSRRRPFKGRELMRPGGRSLSLLSVVVEQTIFLCLWPSLEPQP
jgi:hypothetical protein